LNKLRLLREAKRISAMATLKPEEEEILTFDVSDEALEIAGSGKTHFAYGVCTLDQPGCFPSIFVGDQNTHGIAAEYRRLVASVSRPEEKQALEALARAWDRITDERGARLLKQIDGATLIHCSKKWLSRMALRAVN
jgi:hypothetical protein